MQASQFLLDVGSTKPFGWHPPAYTQVINCPITAEWDLRIKEGTFMANFTGIIRQVDHLGRIVIPKEIRKQLEIKDGKDSLELHLTENGELVMKKYQPTCAFCSSDNSLITFKGSLICKECIKKLNEIEL